MSAEFKEQQWPLNATPTPEDNKLFSIGRAFAAAQAEMHNPGFDSTNPHFRNKFASLAAVRNAVVPIFAKHGICIAQDLTSHEGTIACTTILTHATGQQMRFGPLVLPVSKNDAQGFGSASTYARRYALMAVACVVGDDDDDAQAAVGKPASHIELPKSHITEDQARTEATKMRAILELDIDHKVKALKCLDFHDVINKTMDLYQAASAEMSAAERKAWKEYVKEAMFMEKEDRAVSNVGKRF